MNKEKLSWQVENHLSNSIIEIKDNAEYLKNKMEVVLKKIEEYEKTGKFPSFNSLGEVQGAGNRVDNAIGRYSAINEIYELTSAE